MFGQCFLQMHVTSDKVQFMIEDYSRVGDEGSENTSVGASSSRPCTARMVRRARRKHRRPAIASFETVPLPVAFRFPTIRTWRKSCERF